MATQTPDSAADLRAKLVSEMQEKADAENAKREGKGTRLRVGQTRGKNPQVISWEAFDESKPDTLPVDFDEFTKLSGVSSEREILSLLVDGFNSMAYQNASDPIAEFVNPAWPDDIQKNFRLVVRNYAAGANVTIEDAVALIKPGIEASVKAK